MNRTMRQRPQWSWFRKKELNKFLSPTERPQSTGIMKHRNAINAFTSEPSAAGLLDIDQESVLLDKLIKEILPMADITDNYFVDLFKQGYI